MGSARHKVKSCGKAHSWCKVCLPDAAAAVSVAAYRRYEDPREREKTGASNRGKTRTSRQREQQSQRTLQYLRDHPEARARLLALGTRVRTPEDREKARTMKLAWHAAHPEGRVQQAAELRRYLQEHPAARDRFVAALARYHREHPGARRAVMIRYLWEHPDSGLIHGAALRRYFANDSMTGGARVPAALRDAFAAKQEAFAARIGG